MKRKFLALLVLPLLSLAGCTEPVDTSETSTSTSGQTSINSSTTSSTSVKTWVEKDQDGDVTVSSVPSEIVIGAANSYAVNLTFSRMVINSEAEFSVSDETVLPLEALNYRGIGDGSQTTSGVVYIDATKLTKAGEVYLEIAVFSPNTSGQGGTVTVKLNVVETPDVTYWKETLNFEGTSDFLKIKLEEGQKLVVQFTDDDHVLGTPNPNLAGEENDGYNWFTRDISPLLQGEDSVSVTFDYAVGHHTRLTVYIQGADGRVVNFYRLLNTMGSGSTQTGFNQFDAKSGLLTFINENISLDLTITDETYR